MKIINEEIRRKFSNKGITLIALVITIIVLLILAGVTIATLTGENGILTQASKAKTETTIGEEKEAIALAYNGAMLETNGESVTAEGLNNQFSKNGTKATAALSDDMIKVDFVDTGRSYIVDDYGTVEEFDDIANYLKVGDYVNYSDKNGNKILCKVLYNNENYGVQLVALNPVDTVTLGYGDPTIPSSMASKSNFEKAKYSYNNAIKTLNAKAEEYRNPKYTAEGKARCIGSVPDNPYAEASDYFTSSYSYMSSYNGIFKNTDTNYNEDWNQLETINARTIIDTSKSSYYWLSSCCVISDSNYSGFNVRYADSGGYLYNYYLCGVGSSGGTYGGSTSYGFRPVFRLKSNVKLDSSNGKDGTAEDKAYDL